MLSNDDKYQLWVSWWWFGVNGASARDEIPTFWKSLNFKGTRVWHGSGTDPLTGFRKYSNSQWRLDEILIWHLLRGDGCVENQCLMMKLSYLQRSFITFFLTQFCNGSLDVWQSYQYGSIFGMDSTKFWLILEFLTELRLALGLRAPRCVMPTMVWIVGMLEWYDAVMHGAMETEWLLLVVEPARSEWSAFVSMLLWLPDEWSWVRLWCIGSEVLTIARVAGATLTHWWINAWTCVFWLLLQRLALNYLSTWVGVIMIVMVYHSFVACTRSYIGNLWGWELLIIITTIPIITTSNRCWKRVNELMRQYSSNSQYGAGRYLLYCRHRWHPKGHSL